MPDRSETRAAEAALRVEKDQRREAEQSLRQSQAQIQAILNTAIDAIVSIDERGTVISANRATEKIFGYTIPELIGKNIIQLMPAPYREEHVARAMARAWMAGTNCRSRCNRPKRVLQ